MGAEAIRVRCGCARRRVPASQQRLPPADTFFTRIWQPCASAHTIAPVRVPRRSHAGRPKVVARCGPAGKWLVTNVSDTKYELAYTKAATRLLKYFKVGPGKFITIAYC